MEIKRRKCFLKRCLGTAAGLLAWATLAVPGFPAVRRAIVIDHACTDVSRIPDQWIREAKRTLRIGYGHTSHGSQLVTGLEAYRDGGGALYQYTASGWGLRPGVFFNDYWGNAGGASDLGHGGDLGWRDATVTMLNLPDNDRNIVIWSWCGGVSDNTAEGIRIYLEAMARLEDRFPDVFFVYMTGHLDGGGIGGNLNIRNNQIRDYCIENGKILFDFADIESYDPDGNEFLSRGADDNCDYVGGNWAEEWLAAFPGSELARLAGLCGECAHSHRLNCVLKGGAFWWLLARLAGWPGPDGDLEVTSPNGGEKWLAGSRQDITWTGGDGTERVRLEWTWNRGGVWETIASSSRNDGLYRWTVPHRISDSCWIRVSTPDLSGRDRSDRVFSVIAVDNPPDIALIAPADGAVVSGIIRVEARAEDDMGVARVEFLADGVLRLSDSDPPYVWDWDTSAEAAGRHGLRADAVDSNGQRNSHRIDVTVRNLVLSLSAEKGEIRFLAFRFPIARLTLTAQGADSVPVTRYLVQRRGSEGDFLTVGEIPAGGTDAGSLPFVDRLPDSDNSWWYRALALDAAGDVLAVSNTAVVSGD